MTFEEQEHFQCAVVMSLNIDHNKHKANFMINETIHREKCIFFNVSVGISDEVCVCVCACVRTFSHYTPSHSMVRMKSLCAQVSRPRL